MNPTIEEVICNEAKIPKKILFISDDFDNDHFEIIKSDLKKGNYFSSEYSNYFSFECDLIKNFDDFKEEHYSYDAYLVDYGILGDSDKSIEIMKNLTDNICILVAWCGGLSRKYNNDAKIMFPKETRLHNLPSCDTSCDEMKYMMYRNLRENVSPSEFAERLLKIALKRGNK